MSRRASFTPASRSPRRPSAASGRSPTAARGCAGGGLPPPTGRRRFPPAFPSAGAGPSPAPYRLEESPAALRVGGQGRSRGVAVDGKPFQATGEFLEVDPPRLLVQTWNPDWAPGLKTTLTYRLDAIPGGTRLTLRHEGFGAHREAFAGHTRGWERVLGFLNNHLAGQPRQGVAARYLNPLRLAAYTLVLFCFGHSMGALIHTPSFGAPSDAVWAAMRAVHFRCQTADCTWFGFYEGFGWLVSVFFLFAAAVAWFLGGLD